MEDSELDKFKDIDETSSMVKSFQIGTEIKVQFLTYRVMQLIINSYGQNVVFVSFFQTSEDRNPDIYGMESPGRTCSHSFISFSFWGFVEAGFKKYYFIFNYSVEDSRSRK